MDIKEGTKAKVIGKNKDHFFNIGDEVIAVDCKNNYDNFHLFIIESEFENFKTIYNRDFWQAENCWHIHEDDFELID